MWQIKTAVCAAAMAALSLYGYVQYQRLQSTQEAIASLQAELSVCRSDNAAKSFEAKWGDIFAATYKEEAHRESDTAERNATFVDTF